MYSSWRLPPSKSSSQRVLLSLLLCVVVNVEGKLGSLVRELGRLWLPIRLTSPLSAPLPVLELPSRGFSPTLTLDHHVSVSICADFPAKFPRDMVPPRRDVMGIGTEVTVGVWSDSVSSCESVAEREECVCMDARGAVPVVPC
jgi:hypothetical protein